MGIPESPSARKALKVAELRECLSAAGLDNHGTKPVLLERLEAVSRGRGPKCDRVPHKMAPPARSWVFPSLLPVRRAGIGVASRAWSPAEHFHACRIARDHTAIPCPMFLRSCVLPEAAILGDRKYFRHSFSHPSPKTRTLADDRVFLLLLLPRTPEWW